MSDNRIKNNKKQDRMGSVSFGRSYRIIFCILLIMALSALVSCGSYREEKSGGTVGNKTMQENGTEEDDEINQLLQTKPEPGDGPVVLDVYEHPAYEPLALAGKGGALKKSRIRLSEAMSSKIMQGMNEIDYWMDNAALDRMLYWFDATLSIDGEDNKYYIDFSVDVLVRVNGNKMHITQMDNELSALIMSQCTGRNEDIDKKEDGSISESGACELALLCMKQLAEYDETGKISESDTAADYHFSFETSEEENCYKILIQKRNDIYTNALFYINYKKGGIRMGYVANSLPEEAVMLVPVSYEGLPLSVKTNGSDPELYTDGHYNYIFNSHGHISHIVPVIDYAAPEVDDVLEDAKAYIKRLYPQLELKDEYWGSMGDDCEKGNITVYYEYPLEEYYSVNIITMRYGEDDKYKRLIGAEFHMELLKYLDYADDIVLPTVINEKAEKWLRTYLTENGDETNSTYIKEPKKYLYHPELEIDPSGKAVWKVAFEHIDRGRLTDNSVSAYYVYFDACTGEHISWYAELDTDG